MATFSQCTSENLALNQGNKISNILVCLYRRNFEEYNGFHNILGQYQEE